MAEIHPNDIGLATYADVGDVENLQTAAKTVVAAINEIYENGGNSSDLFSGEQLYVEGENNIILGENNIVYGDNNLVIGSDNIIVGDGFNVVKSNIRLYNSLISVMNYYPGTGEFSFFLYSDLHPLSVGDKVLIGVTVGWTTPDWMDYTNVNYEPTIATVSEINYETNFLKVDGLEISIEPPDNEHTMLDMAYVNNFVPLNNASKKIASNSNIIFGNNADGNQGTSFGYGQSTGDLSFSVNNGRAGGRYSFAANQSEANGECSAAFNNADSFSPYSFAIGYDNKIYGRPLICTNVNWTTRELTIDSSCNMSSINAGMSIIFRCYNSINTIVYRNYIIESVSGNKIKLNSGFVQSGAGEYAMRLMPDRVIYVVDTSTSFSSSNFVGGLYSTSGGRFEFTHGKYLTNINEGAVLFGKYGMTADDYSINLANGTNMQNLGLAFKVGNNGNVLADGQYSSPCADYAECFEWLDGNPDNEDRCGYFVKIQDGKIVKCSEFDTPLGIVSANPAILGDSADLRWHNKYVTDDFGRIQYHDVVVPEEKDENDNVIIEEHTEHQPIINPDWDNETEYIPRSKRPEWAAVGVLGKLIVYDDGTLEVGDVCRCGENGIAVKSVNNGYTVLKRIADDKVLVWFKG